MPGALAWNSTWPLHPIRLHRPTRFQSDVRGPVALDADVDLIEMPLPVRVLPHGGHTPSADLRGEHRTEAADPFADRLMADVDPTLERQVLHVAQ